MSQGAQPPTLGGERVGLPPGTRYRCASCGNLTRFDVDTAERVRRFWHVDLAGAGDVEEERTLQVEVLSVTCRWCGPAGAVQVESVPGATGQAERQSAPGPS